MIVVTCDRPALLRDALGSVAAQSRPALEVRVADNGTDALAPVTPVGLATTWMRAGNRVLASARNLAAARARGDVLAFLDDDDRWTPEHLARLAPVFDAADVEVAYADTAVVRERLGPDGERIDLARRPLARDWDPAMMRVNDWIPPSAFAIRRGVFETLGGFDETLAFSEDWDLLLRAARRTPPCRVPGVSVEVRMRDSGNMSQDFGATRIACLRELERRHGLPPLVPRTFWDVAAELAGPPPRNNVA